MAVAGIRKALVHDSYNRENQPPAVSRCGNEERSTTQTSSIRKMWRDLESEGRVRENGRRQLGGKMLTGCSGTSYASSLECESMESETENKCPQNHDSPLDVPEKERVRKVFRDWGSKSYGGHTRMNNCSRVQSEGGNECKRVKIAREWIESSAQMGGVQDRSVDLGVGAQRSIRRIYGRQAILDMLAKFVRERKTELDGLLENQFVSNFAHRQRIQSVLKGRFLLNQRFVEDKKQTSVAASELGLLRQTHAVSDIRKGFLSKLNASEVVQSRSDNDIKYEQAEEIVQQMPEEEFETNNLTSNWENHNPQEFASEAGERHDPLSDSDTSSDHDMIQQPEERHNNILQYEEREILPATVEFTETRSQNLDDSVEINQEFSSPVGEIHDPLSDSDTSSDHDMIQQAEERHDNILQYEEREILPATVEFTESKSQNQDDSVETNQVSEPEEWHESVTEEDGWYQETASSDSQEETLESWFARNYSYQETAPSGRSHAFYLFDDDTDRRSEELRQLTSRRIVSNLLQSEFGARLNQLMQSYVIRQQDQASESENEAVDDDDSVIQETQEENDQEKEIINDLKVDMDILKQKIDEMQRMLESCMDMQRSVQQEVCSALNHESESSDGKKGVCFLCCDSGFESLPNRSGAHVYICSECGEKVNWSKVKESVRNP